MHKSEQKVQKSAQNVQKIAKGATPARDKKIQQYSTSIELVFHLQLQYPAPAHSFSN